MVWAGFSAVGDTIPYSSTVPTVLQRSKAPPAFSRVRAYVHTTYSVCVRHLPVSIVLAAKTTCLCLLLLLQPQFCYP